MPQMMPMNWLMLFFSFFLIFILFNTLNYYIFNSKSNFKSMKKIQFSMNWKW